MKKVMFALCFALGGAVLVNAQDTTSNQYRTEQPSQYPQDQQMQGQQDRQRIQTSDLPDAVKRSLEDQEYRGWLVSGAFKASASASDSTGISGDQNAQGNNNALGTEGEEIYIVELKNGAETKSVAFDKDGQRIEGWQDQSGQNGQYDQYNNQNQNDQNNQYNQNDQNRNDQMNDQRDQSQSTDPSTQPSDQSTQPSDQSTQPSDQSTQPNDQSTQSTDQSSQSDQHATSPDQSSQSSSSDQR